MNNKGSFAAVFFPFFVDIGNIAAVTVFNNLFSKDVGSIATKFLRYDIH